jgi:hypothetical protein
MVTSVLLRCFPFTIRMLPALFPPDMLNATESKSVQLLHSFSYNPKRMAYIILASQASGISTPRCMRDVCLFASCPMHPVPHALA